MRVAQMPAGDRFARTDLDRMSASDVDYRETVFVRDIVADEYGKPPRERRFRHEIGYGGALVAAAGLEFEDHLSLDQLEARTQRAEQNLHGDLRPFTHVRRIAVVQRKAQAFVLNHDTLAHARLRHQVLRCTVDALHGADGAHDIAVAVPPLQAVLAGGGKPHRAE